MGRPKMPPRRPQDRPKTAQDGPKKAQDGPKIGPRRPELGPRRPQDGPKTAQDSPKTAQHSTAQHSTALERQDPQLRNLDNSCCETSTASKIVLCSGNWTASFLKQGCGRSLRAAKFNPESAKQIFKNNFPE